MTAPSRLLILNAGSSSLKFALYDCGGASLTNVLRGQIAGIGRDATFGVSGPRDAPGDRDKPSTSISNAASPPTLTLPLKGGGNSDFPLRLREEIEGGDSDFPLPLREEAEGGDSDFPLPLREEAEGGDSDFPLPLREGVGGGVATIHSSKIAPPDLAAVRDHDGAIRALTGWLEASGLAASLAGCGHRVVHGGGEFTEPVRLDAASIERLAAFESLAPHHQPHNVAAIRALATHRPGLAQIACFDTAFHATQPNVATRLGLPRALEAEGMRRYGFHGLSYEYVTGLLRAEGKLPARLIVAHLGNGCSMCAVRDGASIATTMGFSTLDGLAMATRSGAVDPGALIHLMRRGMTAAAIEDLLYNKSGLLGISGSSADMKTLLASDTQDAREAVEFFCYRIVREAGSLAAALGGCDAIAFTGGIGENAAPVRARIAQGLGWLGLAIDDAANAAGKRDIATAQSRMRCFVVPTDEERVIARHAARLLAIATA